MKKQLKRFYLLAYVRTAAFGKDRGLDDQGLVGRVRESFTRSPNKSVQKVNRELTIPVTIVLRVLPAYVPTMIQCFLCYISTES